MSAQDPQRVAQLSQILKPTDRGASILTPKLGSNSTANDEMVAGSPTTAGMLVPDGMIAATSQQASDSHHRVRVQPSPEKFSEQCLSDVAPSFDAKSSSPPQSHAARVGRRGRRHTSRGRRRQRGAV